MRLPHGRVSNQHDLVEMVATCARGGRTSTCGELKRAIQIPHPSAYIRKDRATQPNHFHHTDKEAVFLASAVVQQ